MSAPTLENLLDAGEYHARVCLLELGQTQLAPFYHLVTDDDDKPDAIVPCEIVGNNDSDNNRSAALATAVARHIGAVAVLFVTEAWVATYPRGLSRVSPSRHPEREEVVGLFASDGREHRQRSLLIIRNKGGKIIKLTRRSEDGTSLGMPLLDGIVENTSTTH